MVYTIQQGREPTVSKSMTNTQINELRRLNAQSKKARDAYHDCLSRKAPAAERHAAEAACAAAMQAQVEFSKTY